LSFGSIVYAWGLVFSHKNRPIFASNERQIASKKWKSFFSKFQTLLWVTLLYVGHYFGLHLKETEHYTRVTLGANFFSGPFFSVAQPVFKNGFEWHPRRMPSCWKETQDQSM
jgi:hypothetical protein